jgi:hypothetical protein
MMPLTPTEPNHTSNSSCQPSTEWKWDNDNDFNVTYSDKTERMNARVEVVWKRVMKNAAYDCENVLEYINKRVQSSIQSFEKTKKHTNSINGLMWNDMASLRRLTERAGNFNQKSWAHLKKIVQINMKNLALPLGVQNIQMLHQSSLIIILNSAPQGNRNFLDFSTFMALECSGIRQEEMSYLTWGSVTKLDNINPVTGMWGCFVLTLKVILHQR